MNTLLTECRPAGRHRTHTIASFRNTSKHSHPLGNWHLAPSVWQGPLPTLQKRVDMEIHRSTSVGQEPLKTYRTSHPPWQLFGEWQLLVGEGNRANGSSWKTACMYEYKKSKMVLKMHAKINKIQTKNGNSQDHMFGICCTFVTVRFTNIWLILEFFRLFLHYKQPPAAGGSDCLFVGQRPGRRVNKTAGRLLCTPCTK